MRFTWRRGLSVSWRSVPGLLLLGSTVGWAAPLAGAQTADPTAPPAQSCAGLVPPGGPPDSEPGWLLQWDWQWSTFNTDASITWPTAIAVDGSCNVYVADGKRDKIVKLSPQGDTLAQWGSEGKGLGQFDRLEGVAVDGTGNVYAADSGNDRMQKLGPTGGVLLVWANQFACRDLAGVKCQVMPDAFFGTLNVAADNTGNVYVVDANNRVEKFGPDGRPVAKFGTAGSNPGQLQQPRGVALDRQGNIYVADTLNNRIQKLGADGQPVAQWSAVGQMKLNQPRGVAIGGDGTIYIADTDNARVVKAAPDGGYLGQWVHCSDDSDPCQLTGGGEGPGEFSFPYAVAVDARGDVLVADTANNRVQVYKAIPRWVRPDAPPAAPAPEADSGGE